MTLSYLTHDPDEDYDAAANERDRALEKVTSLDKKREKKIRRVLSQAAPRIEQLQDQVAFAKERFRELGGDTES